MTDLTAKNVGDVLSPTEQLSVIKAGEDGGHVFDGVVRAGTLTGFNGRVGYIVAAPGDLALPLARAGEYPSARAHIADIKYAVPATGDRIKFVMNRNSAGDKLALLVTAL